MKNLIPTALIAASLLLFSSFAAASYPFISDVSNARIAMNTSTGVMHFRVSDQETQADQLTLSYSCNNTELIPVDDAHITLGGSGEDRTIIVTPAQDKIGSATILITVTDGDGDTNQDSMEVDVVKPGML